MTTATEFIDERPTVALEPLVDRLIAAIFGRNAEKREPLSIAKAIHEARRLHREGKSDDALATLSEVDAGDASLDQKRWLYNEWLDLVRRCFGGGGCSSTHRATDAPPLWNRSPAVTLRSWPCSA